MDLPGAIRLGTENLEELTLLRCLVVRYGNSSHLVGQIAFSAELHHPAGMYSSDLVDHLLKKFLNCLFAAYHRLVIRQDDSIFSIESSDTRSVAPLEGLIPPKFFSSIALLASKAAPLNRIDV
jgi:hypothetical protein